MTAERDRIGDAVGLAADVVGTLTRITSHAYRNMLKLGRIPLELAYDEDEALGISRTTVYVPAPANPGGSLLRLRCAGVRRVPAGTTANVTPTLAPDRFLQSTLPRWVAVEMPRDLVGGLYELTLALGTEAGEPVTVHTYALYFGRPRAAG